MRNYYSIVFTLFILSQPSFSQPKRLADTTLNKPKPIIRKLTKVKTTENSTPWLFKDTDNLATLIGYILVLTASGLTFWQWRKEQIWRRKEALMNRVTSFSVTPGAWNALLMLGTPDRNVPLWDKEKPEERYVRVHRLEVAVALLPHEFLAITYCPKETAIRDSFNDFLGRLSHLEVYREAKLLNEDEINSAAYNWVITIKKLVTSSDPDDQALVRNFFLYIHDKRMSKVIALFKAFDIPIESKITQYRTAVQQEVAQNRWQRLP